jgi:hypothetical protein
VVPVIVTGNIVEPYGTVGNYPVPKNVGAIVYDALLMHIKFINTI